MQFIATCKEDKLMRVCSLASSSKGNCNIIYTDNEILLVDMGISLKDLEEKLGRLKLNANNNPFLENTIVCSGAFISLKSAIL